MHSNDVKPSHVALVDQVAAASQLNILIASQASITNQMTVLETLERLHHGFMTKQGYGMTSIVCQNAQLFTGLVC